MGSSQAFSHRWYRRYGGGLGHAIAPFVGKPDLGKTSGAAAVVGLGLWNGNAGAGAGWRRTAWISKTSASPLPGTQLFRSLGGALGVAAIFGAIFANKLHALLGSAVPANADIFAGATSSQLATFDRADVHGADIESVGAALLGALFHRRCSHSGARLRPFLRFLPRSPLHTIEFEPTHARDELGGLGGRETVFLHPEADNGE